VAKYLWYNEAQMGIKRESGFTIIETMLFLAVSGLLATIILVGSGVTINQQRYRDSVDSVKSYIQQQYSEAVNVANDRGSNWSCSAAGKVVETEPSAGTPRGTSDCVIVGRLITVDASGTKLSTANVVGARNANAEDQVSDIAEIKTNYKLGVSPISPDETTVSWGAQVVKRKTTSPMSVSILILRSPLSGSILTFTKEGVQSDVGAMVATDNMGQRNLCINADAGSFVGPRLAVRISAYATNQGSITIPPESENVCD
jgi:type II secretory pathway pseudopilin PulG